MRHSVCFYLVAAAAVIQLGTTQAWNYDDATAEGPSHWKDLYPTCGSNKQSPINIISVNALPLSGSSVFTFTNYDTISTSQFTLINNGHSAQVKVNTDTITVSGGGLPTTYVLEQFHFHWGVDSTTGSEHTINSGAHALEVHFVHYDAQFADVATAAASGNPDAVAVIGVFFDVDDANPSVEVGDIADNLGGVPYENDQRPLNAFALKNMLPQTQLTNFYRYYGSLTTPACNEVVIWTVFATPITVSSAQLAKFRQLHANLQGETDELLTHNYRPTQTNINVVYKGSGAL